MTGVQGAEPAARETRCGGGTGELWYRIRQLRGQHVVAAVQDKAIKCFLVRTSPGSASCSRARRPKRWLAPPSSYHTSSLASTPCSPSSATPRRSKWRKRGHDHERKWLLFC